MIVVKKITKTCEACPAQWEGETDTHERIYVRYRSGNFRVEINGRVIIEKFLGDDQNDEEVLKHYREVLKMPEDMLQKMETSFKTMREYAPGSPICFDGSMTYDELRKITEDEIQWPETEDLSDFVKEWYANNQD